MTNLTEQKGKKTHYYINLPNGEVIIGDEFALSFYRNCKDGAGYWNKIRKDFPDVFNEVAEVEIETKHTILKKDGEQLYLRDLPLDMGNQKDLEIPECGLFCDLEMQGLPQKDLEQAREELLNVN